MMNEEDIREHHSLGANFKVVTTMNNKLKAEYGHQFLTTYKKFWPFDLKIYNEDEDMYEQGQFPSTWNGDHKFTFTIYKSKSWSQKSLNIIELIKILGSEAELVKLHKLDESYRYNMPRFDQTLTPIAECGIELIVRKRPEKELRDGGRKPPEGVVSSLEAFLLTGHQF